MQSSSRVREYSPSQQRRPAAAPGVVKLFHTDSCQALGPAGWLLQRGRILVSWARSPDDGRPGHGGINRKRPVKQDD